MQKCILLNLLYLFVQKYSYTYIFIYTWFSSLLSLDSRSILIWFLWIPVPFLQIPLDFGPIPVDCGRFLWILVPLLLIVADSCRFWWIPVYSCRNERGPVKYWPFGPMTNVPTYPICRSSAKYSGADHHWRRSNPVNFIEMECTRWMMLHSLELTFAVALSQLPPPSSTLPPWLPAQKRYSTQGERITYINWYYYK